MPRRDRWHQLGAIRVVGSPGRRAVRSAGRSHRLEPCSTSVAKRSRFRVETCRGAETRVKVSLSLLLLAGKCDLGRDALASARPFRFYRGYLLVGLVGSPRFPRDYGRDLAVRGGTRAAAIPLQKGCQLTDRNEYGSGALRRTEQTFPIDSEGPGAVYADRGGGLSDGDKARWRKGNLKRERYSTRIAQAYGAGL